MPKVSVIVPCLNMKKYIYDCLKSIVNQTLKEIEILVVDAGSSDGTLDIIDSIMNADERIHLIHSVKKSYGYQVNLGIALATGQYIAIVDSDDKIVSDMYEVLYRNAVQSNADYVKGTAKSFYTISDDLSYYIPIMQFPRTEYKNGIIDIVPMKRPDLLTKDNFLWYGIFKRDFIQCADIRLNESPGAAFQDLGGLLQTQMRAQKAVYLEKAFYEYRQDNAASSTYSTKGFQFIWEEYTWAEQFIAGASDGWKAAFYKKMFLHMLSIYSTMTAGETVWEDSREYTRLIREKLKNKLEIGILNKDHFTGADQENLQLFMKNEDALYAKFLMQHVGRKNQLIDIIKKAKNRKIVIFGYGDIGIFVYVQIKKHDLGKVIAFCDNQVTKQGLLFDKVVVLDPMTASKLYPEACFVITSSRYFEDMKNQLISMEISQNHICSYTTGIDIRLFSMAL